MSLTLKRFLFDAYGGFSDKRIRQPERGEIFIIDDRKPEEHSGNGDLNSSFCRMFARVEGQDQITLSLHHNAPLSGQVMQMVADKGGETGQRAGSTFLSVRIRPMDFGFVRQLADAIEAIIANDASRYHVPASYQEVCPRVAVCLKRFADHLEQYTIQYPPPPLQLPDASQPRLLGDGSNESHHPQNGTARINGELLDQQITRLASLIQQAEKALASMNAAAQHGGGGGGRRLFYSRPNRKNKEEDAVLKEIFKTNLDLVRSMNSGGSAAGAGETNGTRSA